MTDCVIYFALCLFYIYFRIFFIFICDFSLEANTIYWFVYAYFYLFFGQISWDFMRFEKKKKKWFIYPNICSDHFGTSPEKHNINFKFQKEKLKEYKW